MPYNLQPTAYSLQPTAYSLQPTAYSLAKSLTACLHALYVFIFCFYVRASDVSVVVKPGIPIYSISLPTLDPLSEYTFPVEFQNESTVDLLLDTGDSGCGCLVVATSSRRLAVGEKSQVKIKLLTRGEESLKKVLTFKTSDGDKVAFEFSANVVARVRVDEAFLDFAATRDGSVKFTFPRIGDSGSNYTFQPPSDSIFEWAIELDDRSEGTAFIRPLSPAGNVVPFRRDFIEVCVFKSKARKAIEVEVPVLFRVPQLPSIIPSRAARKKNGTVSFSVVGDFVVTDNSMVIRHGNRNLPFSCLVRSKRVQEVKIDSKEELEAGDELEIFFKLNGIEKRVDLRIVSS